MSDLSSRLKDLRIKKSLTQKAVADYLEIYEKSYQRYEHGERKLYNDVLIKLANYFNVSVDYLLGLTDNPERNL